MEGITIILRNPGEPEPTREDNARYLVEKLTVENHPLRDMYYRLLCKIDIRKLDEELAMDVVDTLEKAKSIHRETHPGGCKILSMGDKCTCFLCQCDKAIGRREAING